MIRGIKVRNLHLFAVVFDTSRWLILLSPALLPVSGSPFWSLLQPAMNILLQGLMNLWEEQKAVRNRGEERDSWQENSEELMQKMLKECQKLKSKRGDERTGGWWMAGNRGERTGAKAEAAARRLYFKEQPLTDNKVHSYMCLVVDAS